MKSYFVKWSWLPALFVLLGWVYTERHALFGMRLLGGLHAGMQPKDVERTLGVKLQRLKELKDDEKYFDPIIHAETASYYGVEITKDLGKRMSKAYTRLVLHERSAGLEARFLNNQLFGVDVYFVMKGLDEVSFDRECARMEPDFIKQFPEAIRKDLTLVNGGYGLSQQNADQHAYIMCDSNQKIVTISTNSKVPFSRIKDSGTTGESKVD